MKSDLDSDRKAAGRHMKASAHCLFLVSQGLDSRDPSETAQPFQRGQCCCKGASKGTVPCRRICSRLINSSHGWIGEGVSVETDHRIEKERPRLRKNIEFRCFLDS